MCIWTISIKSAVFTEFGKTSIRIKQNPIIFVRHFSFLSNKNFQAVGQLSSKYSEDFAKTACDPDAANKLSFPLTKETPHKIWL